MNPRLLLSIAAVYLALIGLGMLLVPKAFGIGAVPPDASPELLAFLRIFGGPCLGIAVLNWATRKASPSPVQRHVLLGNAVGFVAVASTDVWGVFHGARAVAKIFLVVHLALAISFLLALKGQSRQAS